MLPPGMVKELEAKHGPVRSVADSIGKGAPVMERWFISQFISVVWDIYIYIYNIHKLKWNWSYKFQEMFQGRDNNCLAVLWKWDCDRRWHCCFFTNEIILFIFGCIICFFFCVPILTHTRIWGYHESLNGNFRILKWRYLPYIRPSVQA